MRTKSRVRVAVSVVLSLAVAASIVLLVASCGSSSSSSGSSSSGSSKAIINLGGPAPLTGPEAADGQSMKQGLQLAVSQINASGGLLGRQIKLSLYDIGDMSPDNLTAAAQQLVLQDKCSALVTGYGLTAVDPTIYGKYPVPYLSFDGSQANIDANKKNPQYNQTQFMLGDAEAPYGTADFNFLNALPYKFPNKKIVCLAGDNNWDKLSVKATGDAAKAAGWDMAMYEVFPYGTREWSAELSKIQAINPAVIVVTDLDPADVKTFIDQFAQNPTNSLIDAGYCASIKGFASIVGKNGEGVLGYTCATVLPNAAGQAFDAAFQKQFNQMPGLSITASAYDGVMMWAQAVKTVGNPDDYAKVCAAIHSENYKGVQGTYTFAQYNYVPVGNDLGDSTLPMDEALVRVAVDFGGRAAFVYGADALRGRRVGSFDAELAREFFGGFAQVALCNLHMHVHYGENAHHILEGLFKAFARALRTALAIDPREVSVPSTKGTLTA